MSRQNSEESSGLLRETTTHPPSSLTRRSSRSRPHSEMGTPIASPMNNYFDRNTVLKSYKPSNMKAIGHQSRDRYYGSNRLPPNKPHAAMVSSKPSFRVNEDNVVFIDDDNEKPKRSVLAKMRTKEESISKKKQPDNITPTHTRFGQNSTARTTEVTKRPKTKPTRIIYSDDDEGIDPPAQRRMSMRLQNRMEKRNLYYDTEKINLTEEDDPITNQHHDAADQVFEIDYMNSEPSPRKRRRSQDDPNSKQPFHVGYVGPSSMSKGESSSSHDRMEYMDQSSDEDERFNESLRDLGKGKNTVGNKQRQLEDRHASSDDDMQPSSSIPDLVVPKRRKGIQFHSNPDDIPIKPQRPSITYTANDHTKKSTSGFRTSDIYATATSRITRSATRGIQDFSSNLRGIHRQPQYITIDDDDDGDDVEMQQDMTPQSKTTNGQEVLFHYPSSAPGGVAVVREDANRLMDGQMLNDSIIDFYVKWLLTNAKDISSDDQSMMIEPVDPSSNEQATIKDQSIDERVHVFNTFFFARLKQPTKGDPYENVKKWTSKINLFEKDFVFIPIHEASHWYLLVVCNLKKCIPNDTECIDLSTEGEEDKAIMYSLDSMGIRRTRSANRVIKYLASAAEDRLGIDPQRFKKPEYVQANVPLQPNAYDCGIYVLHFIEKFLQQPEELMAVLTEKELDDNVWEISKIAEKREYISDLITALCERHQQEERDKDLAFQNGNEDEHCDVSEIEEEGVEKQEIKDL